MGENTKIAWCDHTFNPWIGCTKVSPGCDHCYAEREFDLRHHRAAWGAGQPRSRTSEANWKLPLKWNRDADAFLAKKGHRPRVFCASLGDVFDNEVPDEWREELFELIRNTPNLDWLLLTKRPQNIIKMVKLHGAVAGNGSRYLPDNVWLGTTCENQARADANIPHLLMTRQELGARCLFLSIEPMLGRIDLTLDSLVCLPCPYCVDAVPEWDTGIIECRRCESTGKGDEWGIDWVICGGESGPNARPMHPDWVRLLRDQCAAAGVPFFFKQWGSCLPCDWGGDDGNGNMAYVLDEEHTRFDITDYDILGRGKYIEAHDREYVRFPHKKTGDILDGIQHHAWPEVAA